MADGKRFTLSILMEVLGAKSSSADLQAAKKDVEAVGEAGQKSASGLNQLGAAATAAAGAGGGGAAAGGAGAAAGAGGGAGVAGLGSAAAFAGGSTSALGVIALGTAAAVAVLGVAVAGAAAVAATVKVFGPMIEEGIEFNSVMELNKLGIIASLVTYREWQNEQGKVVSMQAAVSAATQESTKVQRLLGQAVFDTTATLQDLSTAYQRLQTGATSQKASSEEIVKFVSTLANFATVTGRDLNTLSSQASLMFLGIGRVSNQLVASLRGLGIDKATLDSWVKQGIAVTEVQKRLEAYVQMGPQILATWKGVSSSLTDVYQRLSGAFSASTFEVLKKGGTELLTLFVDIEGGSVKMKESIVQAFSIAGTALGGMANLALAFWENVISRIGELIHSGAEDWNTTVASIGARFITVFGRIAEAVNVALETVLAMPGALARANDPIALATFLTDVSARIAVLHADWNQRIQETVKELEGVKKGYEAVTLAETNAVMAAKTGLVFQPAPVGPVRAADQSWDFTQYTDRVRNVNRPAQPDQEIQRARDELKQLEQDLQNAADLAGRIGLDRQLRQIDIEAEKALADLMKKAADAHAAAGEIEASRALIEAARASRRAQAEAEAAADAEKRAAQWSAGLLKQEEAYETALADLKQRGAETEEERAQAAGDRELARFRKQILDRIEVLKAGKELEEALTLGNGARIKELLTLLGDAEVKIARRTSENVAAAHARTVGDYASYYKALVEAATTAVSTVAEVVRAQEAAARDTAAAAYADAITIGDGINAAALKSWSEVKRVGQTVADFYSGTWDAILGGFQNLVYQLESGTGSFRSVLDGILDAVKRQFAQTVTELVKKALSGTMQIRDAQGNPVGGSGGSGLSGAGFGGFTPPQQGAGALEQGQYYAGAAGFGYGTGAMVAGFSGAPGFSTGATIGAVVAAVGIAAYTALLAGVVGGVAAGATVGSVVPVIGTIIGAIVGGLIGVLMAPNTEEHVKGVFATLLVRASTDAASEAGRQVLNVVSTGVFETLKAGGGGQLFAAYQRALKEQFQATSWDIAAGSNEDIQATFKWMMQTLVPKLALQSAFGQIGYGPSGNRDTPGGVGGFDWNTPGMDKDGNWIKQQLYDPEAPIPAMLAGLGFTANKIREISESLAGTADPSAFLDSLKALVDVVVLIKQQIVELGKTRQEIVGELQANASASPAEAFRDTIARITQDVIDLANYQGEEEVKKAKEVGDAIIQLRAQEQAEIQKLLTARAQIDQSVSRQADSFGLRGRSTEDVVNSARFAFGEALGHVLSATNGPQVQAAVAEAQQAVQALWEALAATFRRLDQLRSSLESLQASIVDFFTSASTAEADARAAFQSSLMAGTRAGATPDEIAAAGEAAVAAAQKLFEILTSRYRELDAIQASLRSSAADFSGAQAATGGNDVRTWLRDAGKLMEQAAAAAKLSGQAQVDALKDVDKSAQDVFRRLQSLLDTIARNAESLTKDFDAQRFDVKMSLLNPDQQAEELLKKIRGLQETIPGTTDPGKLKETTDQIQALLRQYYSLFAADDPRRTSAAGLVNTILDQTQAAAKAVYDQLRTTLKTEADLVAAQLGATAKAVDDAMLLLEREIAGLVTQLQLLGTAVSTAQESVAREADALAASLRGLRETADIQINGMIDGLLAENAPLWAALQERLTDFTDSTGDAADAADGLGDHLGPDSDLDRALRHHTQSLQDGVEALDDFNRGLRRSSGGGGGGNVVVLGGGVPSAALIRAMRQNPGLLTSALGG